MPSDQETIAALTADLTAARAEARALVERLHCGRYGCGELACEDARAWLAAHPKETT